MNFALVTLEDRRAVYALLDRYLDWLPPTRLSVARPESQTAVGVGRWAVCETCAGTGRMLGKGKGARPCQGDHTGWPYDHRCKPCPAGCERGYRRLHGKQAETGKDPMIDRTVGKETGVDVTLTEQRIAKRRWVEGELIKLRATARQRGDARDERTVTPHYLGTPLAAEAAADDWSRAHDARARLWRTGSFRELEATLELLAMTAPLRFEALRVYVIEQHFNPDHQVRARLDEIVEWLAARMPRPILLPADVQAELAAWKHSLENGKTAAHAAQRRVRDMQIVELVDEHGWSLRRVGRVFDLSHERVRVIVAAASAAQAAVASGPAA